MSVEVPEAKQVLRIADDYGLHLTSHEVDAMLIFMADMKRSYDDLDQLPEPIAPATNPRDPGHRPSKAENPYNAWCWRTEIVGAADGPLRGKRVAVKDNICVAGVPMMNGSRLLEGYAPAVDATVVMRILDAGGTIVGKAACEDLCLSGSSHTAKTGAVRNPRRPTHSSGGSSCGSAAVLACGDADLALGCDQGGSIRIPASWSGVYGLKPTYGLVPYTGIFPLELTLDHCGPMGRSVGDIACLLAVIAGSDGLDPRQVELRTDDYVGAVRNADARGLRIGVVDEGFGHPESEPVVDATVREAAERFRKLGAAVARVSIPMHRSGYAIWATILLEGSTDLMFRGHGMAFNWQGLYPVDLLNAFSRGLGSRPNDLAETGKLNLLMAEHVQRGNQRRYYAKAQRLRPRLREAYSAALREFDVLLMPTVPFRATRLPSPGCSFEDTVARARDRIDTNTGPLDASGHPALSVPCGLADDLPIGMMLIGRHWHESTVLRAAQAFAAATDWTAA